MDLRQKALRGESHEHFRHEKRSEVAKGHERHDGSQTMQVFLSALAGAGYKAFYCLNAVGKTDLMRGFRENVPCAHEAIGIEITGLVIL